MALYVAPAKLLAQGFTASASMYLRASGYSARKAASCWGLAFPVVGSGAVAFIISRKPGASRGGKNGSLVIFIRHSGPLSAVSIMAMLTVLVELSAA